jgi:hypothetical protein
MNEVLIPHKLNHPLVQCVQAVFIEAEGANAYIETPYCPEGDLRQWLSGAPAYGGEGEGGAAARAGCCCCGRCCRRLVHLCTATAAAAGRRRFRPRGARGGGRAAAGLHRARLHARPGRPAPRHQDVQHPDPAGQAPAVRLRHREDADGADRDRGHLDAGTAQRGGTAHTHGYHDGLPLSRTDWRRVWCERNLRRA